MGNPNGNVGTSDSECRDQRGLANNQAFGEQLEQRHQSQLQGNHLEGENTEEDEVPTAEFKPRQRIGSKHCQSNREDDRGNGHGKAVEEVLEHGRVNTRSHKQHLLVVFKRDIRVCEERPPA